MQSNGGSEEKNLSIMIKNFQNFYSNKNNDIIQCALEYNYFLIKSTIENRKNITQNEYNAVMDRLYNNLQILSNHCDNFYKKISIIKK